MNVTQRPRAISDSRPRVPSPLKKSFNLASLIQDEIDAYNADFPPLGAPARNHVRPHTAVTTTSDVQPLARKRSSSHGRREPNLHKLTVQQQTAIQFRALHSRVRREGSKQSQNVRSGSRPSFARPKAYVQKPVYGIVAQRAATIIQRAYRAHRAIVALKRLEESSELVSDTTHDTASISDYVRARAVDLGAFGALLDAAPYAANDPRVMRRVLRVTQTIYSAIERIEYIEDLKRKMPGVVWINKPGSGFIGGATGVTINKEDSSEFVPSCDDLIHNGWHGLKGEPGERDIHEPASPISSDSESSDSDSTTSEADSLSDDAESIYEFYMGDSEPEDETMKAKHEAALLSLCDGSIYEQQFISKIMMAPELKQPGPRTSVSKLPALVTITEEDHEF